MASGKHCIFTAVTGIKNMYFSLKVTILCYKLQNKHFVILMKNFMKYCFEKFPKFHEIFETFKHEIFNLHL